MWTTPILVTDLDVAGVDYGVRRAAVVHPARGVSSVLRLKKEDDLVNLNQLHVWMYSHCARTRPDLVVVESPIQGAHRNIRVGLRLAMVAGALVVAARSSGARVLLVEPATWKSQVMGHGHGNASKADVAAWLADTEPVLSDLLDGDQDAVDAACLGLYGQALLG